MVTSAFSPYNYVALQYVKYRKYGYLLLPAGTACYEARYIDPPCASWREGPRLFWQVRGGVSGVRGV